MNIGDLQIVQSLVALIICWALFAITCSTINELLSRANASRGKFMKKYLLKQLQDNSNGINWASAIYLNGAVDMLSRSVKKPSDDIPPRVFANALVESIGASHLVQSQASGTKSNFNSATLKNFDIAMKVLNASDVVDFLRQSFNRASMACAAPGNGIDEQKVYNTLIENIESWYIALQGRLTLWYKKRTRVRLFLLGVLVALVVNVDSVQLFGVLNSDSKSRAVLIDYYSNHAPQLEALEKDKAHIDTNDSIIRSDIPNNTRKSPLARTTDTALRKSINSAVAWTKKMDSLSKAALLPIGIQYSVITKKPDGGYFLKILGLLLSGFAACVGAPYWFELLKKTTIPKI